MAKITAAVSSTRPTRRGSLFLFSSSAAKMRASQSLGI